MTVGELLLYRIPIYRCNRKKHSEELEKQVEKFMESTDRLPYLSDEQKEEYRAWWRSYLFISWDYNEVIGWLEITKSWTDILIECVMRDSKKFYRVNHGRSSAANFKFAGYKYGEVKTQFCKTSEEIFAELLSQLDGIQKSKQFKQRYFDMEDFRRVGKYIDWKGLTETINVP